MAPNAMVTSPHYLASQSGMSILKKGGNAIDAAIAIASTLAVVYPHMNGIGGDNFWLIHNGETKETHGLNASGRAVNHATIDFYKKQGYKSIPARGYLSANTVPGAVDGWGEAYHYASSSMSSSVQWHELLADAISYAEGGFPVSPSQHHWTKVNVDKSDQEFRDLGRFKEFSKTFLSEEGLPYEPGDLFKQPDLAISMKEIAEKGSRAFYFGEIAEKIVNDGELNGGMITAADLESHTSTWVEPITTSYRGYTAYNLPPNTQGFASLSILNILNNIALSEVEEGSSLYYQYIIEATKAAFKDRDQWLTDPEFIDIPIDKLLSQEHGKDLAEKILAKVPMEMSKPLDPKGDTVSFSVVDEDGNAVSVIQSIYHDFGSGIIPSKTGIVLQNRGSFFSLDENHVNALAPRKRTFHTLNPAMLFHGTNPYLVYGTMGGEGQPQTQAALVTRVIDYGFSVQEAIEAPRWLYGRTWGAGSNTLKLEGRIPGEVMNDLRKVYGEIEKLGNWEDTMGHAGMILIDQKSNVKHGGADPRGDGLALGY
ncbi:gamma-glutamyltransferase [Salipaludibacillus keqinensis]|uniref:Glutathione hydrolase proenzyme n=1 Tax=Salipaludibacillus keqinensis TaxID=2045207 RepID=A0A323TFB2_9BACI|nr:gamma-glutamyltransferase [Salipaludibacillus keqinensis]PYZ93932.1 gamma-glutamyltransferase [Salipaludibacillus keqinensis]